MLGGHTIFAGPKLEPIGSLNRGKVVDRKSLHPVWTHRTETGVCIEHFDAVVQRIQQPLDELHVGIRFARTFVGGRDGSLQLFGREVQIVYVDEGP